MNDSGFFTIEGTVPERLRPYTSFVLREAERTLTPFRHLFAFKPVAEFSLCDRSGEPPSQCGLCCVGVFTNRAIGCEDNERLHRALVSEFRSVSRPAPPPHSDTILWVVNTHGCETARRFIGWRLKFGKVMRVG